MRAKMNWRKDRVHPRRILAGGALALAIALPLASLSGCSTLDDTVIHRGYIFDDQTVAQIRPGMPAEQVLVLLGTPSTTSTVGLEAWYYISQRVERMIPAMPAKVTKQRVFAVYFDSGKKVVRTANYGLKDGRVVDFTTNKTVTGGGENRLLQTLLGQMGKFQYKL
ncbi:outer membrane protein assembly factor BamE [Rhodoblastus acidophilus]|uniref:Outer membrane protein assembly factor BamE n=1 Tax=Candidatus Rhodoblastus alkanivorans TaxID=2954117 RepID=A0ABS9Z6S6_9HYPH|nr:outer membrane protein assembly factor BamE [Candidatus Rhodoblastus alkanivorans]MCI4679155.1 outer membrane protein assembly factor BamE [Candidatus Rhodoblastus alkanivorans]MCI4683151.1 outer membrane protein assembly factor BamE [Candidatus Rhodoblastus alkanivorans]MDI4640462.1 outer membrane protein assembly factor BamE [Rhodoblastus acidophilus]